MERKKILAFGASNSKNSINKKLAHFAANLIEDAEVTFIDLNDYEMPIFGIDREIENGIPEKAIAFRKMVGEHDGIVISFAEHNGAYSTAFKNIFDWISRIKGSTWGDKPMLLMATSPGPRGGQSVLEIASRRFPWNGGKVIGTYSLPSFNINFEENVGITDPELLAQLQDKLKEFSIAITQQEELV
jgi:NAD(P)H-dependent FMN reductase